MGKYLFKRTLNYIVMVFIATSLTFFLAAWRFNPLKGVDMTRPNLNMESIYATLDDKNLSPREPILSRYWDWLSGVTHWNWGTGLKGADINHEIAQRVWVSVKLVTLGSVLGAVIGVLLGAWAATRQYKASDRAFTLWSLVVLSTPTVVMCVVSQIVAFRFNRVAGTSFEFTGETGRHGSNWFDPWLDRAEHLFLPTIVLTVLGVAFYSRYQRNLMLDTLNADFVRTARAKGVRRRKAVFKHALRSALIPTATLFAFSIATVFVGATFTETIFSWQGMGQYGITTITNADVNGTVAVTAFAAVCVLAGAILSEIFVVLLDPRVRVG